MYDKAAKLIANEIYDELAVSDILCDKAIVGGMNDKNFMFWTLIPYIAAISGEKHLDEDETVTFEEAMTCRPDGGQNICHTTVVSPGVERPKYQDSMNEFCGICWNKKDNLTLWIIDTEWSDSRIKEDYYHTSQYDLTLLKNLLENNELSDLDYSRLIERGYISVTREPYENLRNINGAFHVDASPERGCILTDICPVLLRNDDVRKRLLSIGDRIKGKYRDELKALKAPYEKALLDATPEHLRKARMFELQYTFYSDGWFILHCMKELVNSGKLKAPTEGQKKALTMLIMVD